jgi:DNA polymerase-1
MKIAMIRLDAALASEFPRARLLLQIHDELLVEAPKADAPGVQALLGAVMRGAMTLRVPLEVSSATGARWSDV